MFTVGQVICRPTQKEADDYYQHAIIDNADWGAIDGMLANKSITPQTIPPAEYDAKRRYFASNAVGGYPFVGTPDKVADELGDHQPGRRARHRLVVRQLPRRGAVFLRRGAAAPGARRRAGEAVMALSAHFHCETDRNFLMVDGRNVRHRFGDQAWQMLD